MTSQAPRSSRAHHRPRPITPAGCMRYCLYMCDTESVLDETSLRLRLKRATTAVHQHLETQLGLLDPGLDVHRYRRVLETFYGFYVPVEIDATRAAAEPALGLRRAELIERFRARSAPAELAALPRCRPTEPSCPRILRLSIRARRRVPGRTGPQPAVAPATGLRQRQRCCVLRR